MLLASQPPPAPKAEATTEGAAAAAAPAEPLPFSLEMVKEAVEQFGETVTEKQVRRYLEANLGLDADGLKPHKAAIATLAYAAM